MVGTDCNSQDSAENGGESQREASREEIQQMLQATPDYLLVEVPEGKPRAEYTYVERRAAILQQYGNDLPQPGEARRLAVEYGVAVPVVKDDLRALLEYTEQPGGGR